MKIVGLTGGIGSGKSTIARMFADLGIPVYTADQEAKQLMNSDPLIRDQIIELLGEEAYDNQIIDRKFIAGQVFSNPGLLKKLNAIVHPAVRIHFEQWVTQQNSAYVIKEVAILFENGGHKDCDLTILVTAPEEVRIQRVMKRDEATRKEVEDRIKNQWPDEEKIKLADYVVINMNLEKTLEEIKKIHKKILQ